MSNLIKISGLYYDSKSTHRHDDFEWIQFGGSSVKYGVVNESSGGIYFTFPSRDWTLDMTINLGDIPTYRVFGIRSGTYIKDCDIPSRTEKDPLYSISMAIHIGDGVVIKDSFKLRSLSGLDFWFMRRA